MFHLNKFNVWCVDNRGPQIHHCFILLTHRVRYALARFQLQNMRDGSPDSQRYTSLFSSQVDFGVPVKVTRFASQGRQDAGWWVKSYTLSSSVDGGYYTPYQNNKVCLAAGEGGGGCGLFALRLLMN